MRLIACVFLSCALLAACNRDAGAPVAPAAPAPPVEPVATPPSADPTPQVVDDTRPVDARVASVDWSDTAGGAARKAAFAKDAVVHLGIHTEGSTAPYTLSAKWLAPDGAVLTEYGQRVEAPGPQVTDFSLSRPDGWPPGRYTVQLAINGKPMQDAVFNVE